MSMSRASKHYALHERVCISDTTAGNKQSMTYGKRCCARRTTAGEERRGVGTYALKRGYSPRHRVERAKPDVLISRDFDEFSNLCSLSFSKAWMVQRTIGGIDLYFITMFRFLTYLKVRLHEIAWIEVAWIRWRSHFMSERFFWKIIHIYFVTANIFTSLSSSARN